MRYEQGYRAWAYARDTGVHPSVVIGQMAQLLGEAERRGIPVVGASQDISSGRTLERMGLLAALRAVRSGYANALLVRDVSRLSGDRRVLLRIMEVLQDNDAILLCTAEDVHTSLRLQNISQQIVQRAACLGLDLSWFEKEGEI